MEAYTPLDSRDDRWLTGRLAVYLVADPEQTTRDLEQTVTLALAGGVTAVQLRTKRLPDRAALELGRSLAARCRETGALFLVNDRLDLALLLEADGVHLGVDDVPPQAARQIAPPGFIIGYSPETDDQTRTAHQLGVDYLGVGPVYTTTSKLDAGSAIGLDGLKRRSNLSGVPVIGIGGIDLANADEVIRAGAVGVAVISAILHANDPEQVARELVMTVQPVRDSVR